MTSRTSSPSCSPTSSAASPPATWRGSRGPPPRGEPEAPEPWLLGSSEQSALWAGELGLRYAFADFINPRGAPIATTYRRSFVAGQRLAEPRLAVAVRALVAPTEEEAELL